MTTTTLDQALAVARTLTRHERARLVAVLVEELAQTPAPPTSTSEQPRRGDPRAVVATVLAHGPWKGDDLEERLREVYAARAPLRFEEEAFEAEDDEA